jgi:crossover junction endodeoxyribonuclease RuvC
MDVIKLNGKKDMFERLGIINDVIQDLIKRYKPHEVAIEAPFFGKNVQSMLKLGRAQGVAIAVAISNKLPVAEYSPKKVKQSITGNGNATKEQIWKMLNSIMTLKQTITYFDASDALAVAVATISVQMPSRLKPALQRKLREKSQQVGLISSKTTQVAFPVEIKVPDMIASFSQTEQKVNSRDQQYPLNDNGSTYPDVYSQVQ